MTVDPGAALAAARRLGPFCRLDDVAGPDWVDAADLVGSPEPLAARCREVAGLLGPGAEDRVVASLVHLGVVARVLSPALGAALAGGVLPAPATVRLLLRGSNPVPMAWAGITGVRVSSPDHVARALVEHWLDGWVTGWTDRVAGTGVSRQVLIGNVVSALHGAVVVAATAQPRLAGPGRAVLTALLATGPLAGTGAWRPDGTFVRRSCCLFQRLPGGGTCADCVLVDPVPA